MLHTSTNAYFVTRVLDYTSLSTRNMICSNMPSALHLRCPSRARHAASRPLVRSYLRRGSGSGNGATGESERVGSHHSVDARL